jgi:transposase-like protein
MAHSRAMKMKAVQLWASGDYTLAAIGQELGVNEATIETWKRRNKPVAWEGFRAEVEARLVDDAKRQLSRRRAELAIKHFKGWELLDQFLRRALYEEVADPSDPTGETRVLRPKALSAIEIRAISDAYSKVQVGQRLVFGESGYLVGMTQAPKADGLPADMSAEQIAKIEQALAAANSDPGPEETADGGEEE